MTEAADKCCHTSVIRTSVEFIGYNAYNEQLVFYCVNCREYLQVAGQDILASDLWNKDEQ